MANNGKNGKYEDLTKRPYKLGEYGKLNVQKNTEDGSLIFQIYSRAYVFDSRAFTAVSMKFTPKMVQNLVQAYVKYQEEIDKQVREGTGESLESLDDISLESLKKKK